MLRMNMLHLCRPGRIPVPNGVPDERAMRLGQFHHLPRHLSFRNSLPLVELALNLVDAGGRQTAIRGPVRNGSTLTSAFVDVIIQNGGNCRVSFCEYFRIHWIEYVNLPSQGFHIGGCGQFYDDRWRMILLPLPNEKIVYASMDNLLVTHDSAFCFRDDVGFIGDLPNPESLLNGAVLNGTGINSGTLPDSAALNGTALAVPQVPWLLDDETRRIISVFRTDDWIAVRLPDKNEAEKEVGKGTKEDKKGKKAEKSEKTPKSVNPKSAVRCLLYYDFRN